MPFITYEISDKKSNPIRHHSGSSVAFVANLIAHYVCVCVCVYTIACYDASFVLNGIEHEHFT